MLSLYFFKLAIASITPKTIPSNAANNTRHSTGNKKVMVCAGIQKKGIVFFIIKFHCTSQFKLIIILLNLTGVKNPFKIPPLFKI